jgi:hypothetical protein
MGRFGSPWYQITIPIRLIGAACLEAAPPITGNSPG